MKKLFLIPLLACFSCVMAWGTEIVVNDFATLKTQLSASGTADVVKLGQDIAYPTNGSDLLNIERSLTLDGQGHKISGYGDGYGRPNVIGINYDNTSYVDVTLKNLDIYSTEYRPLETRGYLTKLTLDNVNITSTGGSSNPQGLTIGGTQTDEPYGQLVIKDSKINVGNSGYPVLFWNPTTITLTNSNFKGYCALYFKSGSANSVVNADACDFDAPNVHAYAGGWNNFGVFTMEDQNITLNLHNCGMNSEETGFAKQGMILAEMPGCIVNISGDNSHINGKMVLADDDDPGYWLAFLLLTEGNISITGGTYSVDPSHFGPYNPFTSFGDQEPTLPNEDFYANFVPSTHEVQEVQQGSVTLYRVVKKAQEKAGGTLYDLNDLVKVEVAPGDSVAEGVAAGNNPISSFDLSTGTEMKLNQETTTAGYVQVSDNGDDATIIKVGKVENETKVDQTLVINNGLDVQGESQVVVQAGSTVQIGEGGINTEKPSNIVIEADENGAASLIMDPTITVNQTPNLTVRMTAKQIGKLGSDYYWHRFALPVAAGITSWEKEGSLVGTSYPTYLYGWDYAGNQWQKLPNGVADMNPLQGYTLTLASEEIPGLTTLQDVTYIFKGNLVGNTDQALNFKAEGFNFFGNSYTGYMDVLTLIQGIESNNVEGTVYMWCNDPDDEEGRYQSYEGVPLYKLQNASQRARLASWQQEVAPMQTFILRLRGADSADESVNYASAIWGNPRYGNSSAPAPRRRVAAVNNEESYFEIRVKAANGKGDHVDFTQDANHNDAFESGFDAVKYLNERTINLYTTINGEDFSSVVTNNIEGKTLSLKTNDEIAYTMSFKNVEGEEYAIRDNVTGNVIAIEEGATYEFAAQPNSLVENRFEIIVIAKVPTAIENAAVKANAKGIYTIMGQYLGEDFKALPAGVYVVDGVKIVK